MGRPTSLENGTKICSKCRERKPIEAFDTRGDGHKNTSYKGRPKSRCRKCLNEYLKKYNKSTVGSRTQWSYALKRRFGMTIEQYEVALDKQGGVCAICKNPPAKTRLAVDHNHANMKFRGLLCKRCNQGIGLFEDSPKLFQASKEYLERTLEDAYTVSSSRR